jgi:hypothetical protein
MLLAAAVVTAVPEVRPVLVAMEVTEHPALSTVVEQIPDFEVRLDALDVLVPRAQTPILVLYLI